MRRSAAILFALGAVLPAGASASPLDRTPERPALDARLASCHTGEAAADRYAVFTGSMPAGADTARMEMRFDLYQRRAAGLGYAHVALPKWGQWERSSRSGASGFIFTKRVEQLVAPAVYRAVVRFRWYDADGDLVRTAKRASESCRQPDPRADLRVGDLRAAPDGSYLVDVHNEGRSDAGPFLVSLAVGGTVADTRVDGLAAHGTRTVVAAGGRCTPGELIRVEIDTTDAVDEARETDDSVVRSCPFESA